MRNDDTGWIPRPGSAMARPGTSSGRRNNESGSSNTCPDLIISADSWIKREMGNDGLLRILNSDNEHLCNKAIIFAENGDLSGLMGLVSQGLDVSSCRGLNGFTLLHHACNRGHVEIASEILKMNVSVNSKNNSGETSLHLAVYGGHLLTVDLLLDKGANVNSPNNTNETPLFYAARKNNPAMVRLLIQRGATTEIRDDYDDRPIDHTNDKNTIKAFNSKLIEQSERLSHNIIMQIYSYLRVNDLLRCSCVSTRWHRISETDSLWKKLGVRRWELALQRKLGFGFSGNIVSSGSNSHNNSSNNMLSSSFVLSDNIIGYSKPLWKTGKSNSNKNTTTSTSNSSNSSKSNYNSAKENVFMKESYNNNSGNNNIRKSMSENNFK